MTFKIDTKRMGSIIYPFVLMMLEVLTRKYSRYTLGRVVSAPLVSQMPDTELDCFSSARYEPKKSLDSATEPHQRSDTLDSGR